MPAMPALHSVRSACRSNAPVELVVTAAVHVS